jgi:hypothetical protein
MALKLPDDREVAFKVIEFQQAKQEQTIRMGVIGRITGEAEHKAGNIVVFVIVLCFIFVGLLIFDHDTDLPRREIIFSLISVITLSLGYYFGKKSE